MQTIDLAQTANGDRENATLDVDLGESNPANSFDVAMTVNSSDPDLINRATGPQETTTGPLAPNSGSDGEATFILEENTPVPIHAAQTLLVGGEATDQKTIARNRAKTEGQLENIWKGAVGSSANPMHSLSAAGMQASDTIFERVAVRKVLDLKSKESTDADYRIVDKLGEGGMGIVFTARQTSIDRLVALKVAKPKFQKSPDARKRFLYEAQITADLDHSNIVPIHELGISEDGMLFYSMKIVDGDQWSLVMSKKTREQNLDIFMKVADAVAFAHSKGIIHRDLKPENTMLGRYGEVFVTDWGTAVNLSKDSSVITQRGNSGDRRLRLKKSDNFRKGESIVITNDTEVFERNEVVSVNDSEIMLARPLQRDYTIDDNLRVVKAFNLAGTPCYMAPEMAGHMLNRISCASDVYVLGAILFDMVTGRPPHSGPTVTHCLMHALSNELVIPESAQDDALLTIALKAMASEPRDRYQTVEQMQEAIRQYRRHAESISLTERSSALLAQAKESEDYQTYSRAMFGFRDAIELWPENSDASEGLLASRLAYAESAYSKGDYDLVMQTVDCAVPAESELQEKARIAKQRRLERETRIKLLQRLVAIVVTMAILCLSALSFYAFNEQRKAIASASAEKQAKLEAQNEKQEAEAAKKVAVTAQIKEEEQRVLAEQREKEAERGRQQAVLAQEAERLAKRDAQRKAIQIQLDEYKSSIALAGSRLASFDVRSAREILDQILLKASNVSDVAPPAFQSWGWQRIRLLGNADLPQTSIAGRVIATASASKKNLLALATDKGEILIYTSSDGVLNRVHEHKEPGATIGSLALSDDGSQLVYTFTNDTSSGIRFWNLGKGAPETVRSTLGKSFQSMMITRDGRYLVSGISAGLWIWDLSRDGWLEQDQATYRLNNVRGRSVSVQEIADKVFLLTVDFNNERELRLVNASQETNDPIPLPDSIRDIFACGVPIGDGQIALGLKDSRIAIATLSNRQIIVDSFLEQKHASAVTKLVQGRGGRLISMSDAEPVAQVWRKMDGRWQHESFLSGLRENLVDLQSLPDGTVLGMDTSSEASSNQPESRAIVWNIDRQIQRIRMERPVEKEKGWSYPESVKHIVTGGYDSHVLTVDANSCINTWNLVDGKINHPAYSYLGHTPGSELVDSVSNVDANVLVTVAKLRDAEHAYISDRGATWEFCVWDLNSQQMIRRWTRTDTPLPGQTEPASIEPRLTLLDHGTKLLLGSDTNTVIIDTKTGKELLNRKDWGSYFAIENPTNRSQVLLIKRTGAVRLLDIDEWRWDEGRIDDVGLILATVSPPMQAVWSPRGDYFYLAYSNGDIAKVKIIDLTATILWHSEMLVNDSSLPVNSLRLTSGEVRLHTDIDLALTNDGEIDNLQSAIRLGNSDRFTRHVKIKFSSQTNLPRSIDSSNERFRGNYWLKRNEKGEVVLTDDLHKTFAIDRRRVRVMQQLKSSMLVSSQTGHTYVIESDSEVATRYGRVPVISVTGDRRGSAMYCLHEDGSVTSYAPNDDAASTIKNVGYALPNASRIGLSSDSKYLASVVSGNLSVIDPISGQALHELGPVRSFAWNPLVDSELAICTADGNIKLFGTHFEISEQIPAALKSDETIVGMHFFNEIFDAPNVAPRRHILVHTRDLEYDYVNIVALAPLPGILTESDEQRQYLGIGESIRQALRRNSLLAASPTEGIFATGSDNGTVNVWYCSPTWGPPRELFDLIGHRGAKLTSIAFTTDGCTLLTADDNKRLFAWITKDPQGQVEQPRAD